MSDELTFGVKLTGEGSSLRGELVSAREELVNVKKSTDDLAVSASKMASQYSGMDAALAANSAAVAETDGRMAKLLDRYDPLGAKLRQLKADFKALDAAASSGMIAGRDDARVDQAYRRIQSEINATTAAAGNFGSVASGEMSKVGRSAGQLRMATQQLPMQFTDIWVSLAAGQTPMMVMLQQGTQIKDSFGGVGVAAKAMGGYILGLINPITLVTAAVAAGAYAWYQWGDAAEESLKKAQEFAKDAQKDAAAASAGIIKTDSEKLRDLQRKIDGATGQLDAAIARRNAITRETGSKEALAIGAEVIARREELAAYERQIDQIQSAASSKPKKASDSERLLEQARRFDEQMVASHDDAFTKTINGWVALQDKMIAAGAYGAEERKAHEAAYTEFVNDENAKREAAADEHTAKLVAKQNEKFAALQQRADTAGMTDKQRDEAKYQRELAGLERDRATMVADHELTLAEIEAFELAKYNITVAYQQQQMRNEASVANFSKLLRQGDFTDAMSMAQQLTAGLATHSRAAFEVNKAASLAKATVSGYQMIQAAAADGASWGGYWGAIGEGLLAAAYVAANIQAINSTEFGGGGSISVPSGGNVPSLATTPGTPVNDTTSSQQVVQVTIYNTGNVQTSEFADQMVTQIRDQISNSDVILIDPRSRQAAILGAQN